MNVCRHARVSPGSDITAIHQLWLEIKVLFPLCHYTSYIL